MAWSLDLLKRLNDHGVRSRRAALKPELRIDDNELDFDGDQRTYNGAPFNGIGFLVYPNSQLKREAVYRDGFEEGLVREWHPNGQLKKEWFAVHGQATGKLVRWHDNGQIASVVEAEYGSVLRRDEWDRDGKHLKNYQIDPNSAEFKYVQEMRRKHGRNT